MPVRYDPWGTLTVGGTTALWKTMWMMRTRLLTLGHDTWKKGCSLWSPSNSRVVRSSPSRLDLEKPFRWSSYRLLTLGHDTGKKVCSVWSPSNTRVGRSSHSRLDLEKQFRWSAYSIGVECEICLSSPTIADCLTYLFAELSQAMP